jgi:SAM-dependent methyltransferase
MDDFIYCIDNPKMDEPTTDLSSLILQGWIAVEKPQKITDLRLNCPENKQLEQHLVSLKRPDVEQVYPDHNSIGFSKHLSLIHLYPKTTWLIQFVVGDNNYQIPLNFAYDDEIFNDFLRKKETKLRRIKSILSCPDCRSEALNFDHDMIHCCECGSQFSFGNDNYNFLSQHLKDYGKVTATSNVSSNGYDGIARKLIEDHSQGLILDNGCGLRSFYYENVVNFEIVDYLTTDVLGIGEKLPFKSNSFDAIFSLAVLEHVKNPFECASEIERVLKPGGVIYVAVPFLQPFHGYPDHYYNMTSSGLKNLFSEKLEILDCNVPLSGLPIWCLTWFLNSYVNGLPEAIANKFKEMKVSELLNHPETYLKADFVTQLSPQVAEELACVNYIIAKKIP